MRSATYGDDAGVTMSERTLSTKKLISQSFLGNETEEDAILPILPLIRESMVRSHARAIENSILAGDDADGALALQELLSKVLLHLARNDSDLYTVRNCFRNCTMLAADFLQ